MRRLVCTTLTIAVTLLAATAGPAGAAPTITEFSSGVTPNSGAQGIAMGPDGNMWFTEFGADKIGRITPAGVVTEFALPGGTMPYDIAAGHDGAMWFSEWGANAIGRIATDGTLSVPVPLTLNAHPTGVTADRQGMIWASESGTDKIARYDPSTSFLTEIGTGISAGAAPRGIAPGPDFAVWFAELGRTNVGRLRYQTLAAVEHPFTSGEAIAASEDGLLWLTNPNGNQLSFLAPDDSLGGLTAPPTPGSFPEDIVAGPDGRMWFTEANGNRIGHVRLNESSQDFGNGISPSSGPFGIATGPDGAMWFTETAGRIGRATTDAAPFRFTSGTPVGLSTGTGMASVYPTTIDVSGLSGIVTRVRVRLNGLFATTPEGLRALLVDPAGHAVTLFSGIGGSSDAAGALLTFADDGMTLDQPVSGVYVPTDSSFAFSLPAPAPRGPYTTSLSAFDGADPNGQWKLYLAGSGGGRADVLAAGWSLDVQTAPPQVVTVTTPGGSTGGAAGGTADTTPAQVTLAGVPRSLTRARLLRGFRITLRPNEPAAFDVALTGTTRRASLASTRMLLLERSLSRAAGIRTLTIKPSRSAFGKPRKTVKLRLRVVATDAGGNRTTVTRTIAVRPDRPKRRR